eukprot:CAMPEP_0194564700 /NCGR_PEP_ID=MMETSP0292-20121207/4247_1 /TAXON_ID=39354 /ORGANISM="Heterosigma akashiwo, Strain CCMP2393" /LENGTH=223 /DNA_ID=CAMNT_0039413875 /DNA_START=48 /DNA_END=716 /DNA_ORIENTATION=+
MERTKKVAEHIDALSVMSDTSSLLSDFEDHFPSRPQHSGKNAATEDDELPTSHFLPQPKIGSVQFINAKLDLTLVSNRKHIPIKPKSIFSEEEEKLWGLVKGTDISKPLDEDRKLRVLRKRQARKSQMELSEQEVEKWLSHHKMNTQFKFSFAQRRELKRWFDSMDKDGSGEIGVMELAVPLLSTGIARSMQEVKNIIKKVDKDNSGEIGFDEFLEVLRPKGH